MRIKMLNDRFDNETKIWRKNDIFIVKNNADTTYFMIKIINGEKYGVSKAQLNKEYIIVNKDIL